MENLPGFVTQGEIGKVCRLRKSLYGLKQSFHAWFGKFSQVVEKFSLQKSKSDHFIFYRNSSLGIILLVVYVDDIVITGSDSTGISSLKSFLHGQFHTKDLGCLDISWVLKLCEVNMESSYLKGNTCLIYYLRLENWEQSHIVPLWLRAYTLLEKASCLRILRYIED